MSNNTEENTVRPEDEVVSPLLVSPVLPEVKVAEDDILAQGINMMVSDNLRPNAQYVLRKIREVADGQPITSGLVMELVVQAMLFASMSDPTMGGGLKKEVVMYALRKFILDAENLDLTTKTSLFLILQPGGFADVTIDQLFWASRQAKNLFTGMTNGCLCGLVKPKPKNVAKDFNPNEEEKSD